MYKTWGTTHALRFYCCAEVSHVGLLACLPACCGGSMHLAVPEDAQKNTRENTCHRETKHGWSLMACSRENPRMLRQHPLKWLNMCIYINIYIHVSVFIGVARCIGVYRCGRTDT